MIFRGIMQSDIQKRAEIQGFQLLCDPGGARTHDPMIKSHLLYQLSHGVILEGVRLYPIRTHRFPFCGAKLRRFLFFSKFFPLFLYSFLFTVANYAFFTYLYTLKIYAPQFGNKVSTIE